MNVLRASRPCIGTHCAWLKGVLRISDHFARISCVTRRNFLRFCILRTQVRTYVLHQSFVVGHFQSCFFLVVFAPRLNLPYNVRPSSIKLEVDGIKLKSDGIKLESDAIKLESDAIKFDQQSHSRPCHCFKRSLLIYLVNSVALPGAPGYPHGLRGWCD